MLYSFDFSILDFIQTHLRSTVGDAVMQTASFIGDKGMVWIGLTLVLLAIPKTRKAGAAVAAALIMELILCNLIIKPYVARIRPFDVNTTVQLLVSRPTDYSFPSGHTGASFAATAALFAQKDKMWIPSLVLSILISFSRLYLYVHYPTDVIAGVFLGTMMGLLGSAAVNFIYKRYSLT